MAMWVRMSVFLAVARVVRLLPLRAPTTHVPQEPSRQIAIHESDT
jgi:hypothetical protein